MKLYYEAENINSRLNQMNETELASDYAQRLMDRLSEIRRLETCAQLLRMQARAVIAKAEGTS